MCIVEMVCSLLYSACMEMINSLTPLSLCVSAGNAFILSTMSSKAEAHLLVYLIKEAQGQHTRIYTLFRTVYVPVLPQFLDFVPILRLAIRYVRYF